MFHYERKNKQEKYMITNTTGYQNSSVYFPTC